MRLGCAAVVGPLCLWQMCPGTENTQVNDKHVNDIHDLWCRITSQNRPPFIRNYCNLRVGTPGNPLKTVSDRICVTNLLVFFTDVSCLHPCEWTWTQKNPHSWSRKFLFLTHLFWGPSTSFSFFFFSHFWCYPSSFRFFSCSYHLQKRHFFKIGCKSRWQLENILFTYLHVKRPHVLQVVILYDFVNSRLLEGISISP